MSDIVEETAGLDRFERWATGFVGDESIGLKVTEMGRGYRLFCSSSGGTETREFDSKEEAVSRFERLVEKHNLREDWNNE